LLLKEKNMERKRLRKIWQGIKRRCLNEKDDKYLRWGGRGIKIYDDWFDFEKFYTWAINNGYKDGLTLDRKNVNGNYCPENCRWATAQEQARNRTNNRYLTVNGEKKLIIEWAELNGIDESTIRRRIASGKNSEEAISKARFFGKMNLPWECSTPSDRGITQLKTGKWRARIHIKGKRISLGCFVTSNEARQAYIAAINKVKQGKVII
jgi:hypothetical protein